MRKRQVLVLLGAWMISCALWAEGVDPVAYIREALQRGETTIRLPKGVYDLEPGDVASLHLKDVKDVVLDFQGSEFRGKKKSGMLKLQSCRGVTIRNLTIDYPFNLPFTQGFVEQVGTNGEWTVRIAKGYPDPEDGRWGWPVQAYDAQTGDLVNPMRYLDGIKVSRLEPGRYRVTGGRNRKGKVGDVAVWSLPCDTVNRTQSLDTRAHAVYLVDCANCRVENVTVHSTPGSNGFREILGAGGNVYSHCAVVPRPPETDPVVREIRRFRSGNHDAFNSRAVKRGPALLACTARNHCDDDVNIHGPYQFITAVEGAKVRAFIRDMYVGTLRVGDPVQFVTAKGYSPEYTLRVVDIAPAKPTEAELAYVKKGLVDQIARACNTLVEVTFERADPILRPGTLFVSQNAAGNGFSLQRCTFGPNRARGFICNASYGEVIGCTFDRTESSGVLSRPSYQWLEGGASRNVRFRDCTFIDCGVNFGVHREMMTTNACHRSIVFSGCRFSGTKGRLEVACCTDLCLDGNTFALPVDKAVTLKLTKTKVETWRMTELEFVSGTDYDAGGGDSVRLDAVFSNRTTGVTIRRPGFWDGGKRFLVRFAPTAPGEWDWATTSGDAGLNGRKGTLSVVPYAGKLDIYRHGFLKVVPGKKYFVHADGTPFFYLGDTHWGLYKEEIDEPGPHAGSTGATSHFKHIVDRRVEQGFTVYQSEPIGAKFKLEDGRIDASDIPGLRLADRYYRHIAEAGLVHANGSFFFAAGMNEKLAKDEAALARISRYWVARFGAYPVLWTLAQEIDNDFYSERGAHPFYNYSNNPWVKVAECMHREDAYAHPLSGHQENTGATTVTGRGTNPDKTKISGNGVSVFADAGVSARTGHNWWAAQWSPSLTGRMDVQVPSDYWNSPKPAVNYEGRYCGLWTKDTGARAQGWLAFLSGFCGYGYGAIDMWLYLSAYDVKNTSRDGVDVITPEDKAQPWSASLEYPSALQMAHLKKFLQSFDWWNLKPDLGTDSRYDGLRAISVHAVAGCRHVFYFYGKGREAGSMKGLAAKSNHTLRWFNPRTGEWLPPRTVSAGEDGRLVLPPRPDESDWALELVPSSRSE